MADQTDAQASTSYELRRNRKGKTVLMSAQTQPPANLLHTVPLARPALPDRRRVPVSLMVVVLVAATLVAGCATAPASPAAAPITPEMLLAGLPLAGDARSANLPDTDVLGLDPVMLEFLDRFVDARQADRTKLRQLLYAIMDEGSFGLVYDDKTRTAAETFHEQRGNCLSFTNMFVAMARQVGIDASFQEVDVPPDWGVQDGVFVLSRHVNVFVDLDSAAEHVVDFNIDNFRSSYDRRKIRDRRALAHYYNNVGAEHLQAGETVRSLLYLRKAVDNDRRFSPPWDNLGTLYRRNARPDYAEAAYLQALDINPADFVAMSNLAALYKKEGDAELASTYRRRAQAHRMRNPYYRYRLARDAFLGGDYDTAIGHLKFSVRKKKNEDAFYFLMGMSYLKKGDASAARSWLQKAAQVAGDDDLQRKYHSKLEMLLSVQE